MSRNREVPAGTVGGRKQPTRTPRSRHDTAAANATSGSPRITDTTAESGRSSTPHTVASAAAWSSTACARHGSAINTSSAAHAAPTAAGASPVSKMNGRAASMRWSRTAAGPSTTPPWLPSALDIVVVTTTSGAPAKPTSCTSPRPPVPRTPSACASSTTRSAPCRRHTSCNALSGASTPSAENTASVTTTARSSARPASAASTAATSRCGVTTTLARDSRHASTREACVRASDTSSEPGAGQRHHRAQVRGVARREHQRRLGADETGERRSKPS